MNLKIWLKFLGIYSALAIAMVQGGCAVSARVAEPDSLVELPLAKTDSTIEPNYDVLDIGDRFRVQIFNEPDLSGDYAVDSNYMVSFPLVGRLLLKGLDSEAVAKLLKQKYSDYLRLPRVSVSVTEFRSKKISIFGLVKKPGTFPYETGMTIVHAITLAGGFKLLASENETYVSRKSNRGETKFQITVKEIGKGEAKNLMLMPGDVIYVPESAF